MLFLLAHSAIALADRILAHNHDHPLTILHVLKLAYICHGWNLALYDRPLIGDEIEAWPYGPVIPTLYRALRVHRKSPINRLISCDTLLNDPGIGERRKFFRSRFSEDENNLIDEVLYKYGDFSALELSDLTHQKDTPWSKCYDGRQFTRIPNDVIKAHYRKLLYAGQK